MRRTARDDRSVAFHLLQAIESCHELFSRYGGHAHAVGFALPSANVEKLREHLDGYARARLTPPISNRSWSSIESCRLARSDSGTSSGAAFAGTFWDGESRACFCRAGGAADGASAGGERQACAAAGGGRG
jgi:hypothetical protein